MPRKAQVKILVMCLAVLAAAVYLTPDDGWTDAAPTPMKEGLSAFEHLLIFF